MSGDYQAPKVRTCLWFQERAWEAVEFYVSVLPDSSVETNRTLVGGKLPSLIEFTLGGTPYMILEGGPRFRLNEAASIIVMTEDQEETDRLWEALLSDGGTTMACGWLTDRFGVAWQIIPRRLIELLSDPDSDIAEYAMNAMHGMVKIVIAELEADGSERFRGCDRSV